MKLSPPDSHKAKRRVGMFAFLTAPPGHCVCMLAKPHCPVDRSSCLSHQTLRVVIVVRRGKGGGGGAAGGTAGVEMFGATFRHL